jgi:hypothetical protein
MPNWCYNSVKIEGDAEDIKRFISMSHGEDQALSFDKILPAPPGIYEQEQTSAEKKTGKLPDWYDWCCTNWGTKWDIDSPVNNDVEFSIIPSGINYTFQTAWSPALQVFNTVAERFPSLRFDYIYSDESMGFAGRVIWKNGKLNSHKEFSSENREYDCIAGGARLEEIGVGDTGWISDIPVSFGVDTVTKKNKTKKDEVPIDLGDFSLEGDVSHRIPPPDPERRQKKIQKLHQKVNGAEKLKKILDQEIVALAKKFGFDFTAWKEAGFNPEKGDLWNIAKKNIDDAIENRSNKYSIAQVQIKKRSRGGDQEGTPGEPEARIVLRGRRGGGLGSGKPELSLGSLRLFQYGVEVVTPSGWGIQGLIKDGERAYLVVRHDGRFQNPVSGDPCCTEWSATNAKDEAVVKTGEAFCVDGKLWDPRRDKPALSIWYENGEKKLEARFFDNKNVSAGGGASAVFYKENGEIERKESRRRGLKRGKGNSHPTKIGRIMKERERGGD